MGRGQFHDIELHPMGRCLLRGVVCGTALINTCHLDRSIGGSDRPGQQLAQRIDRRRPLTPLFPLTPVISRPGTTLRGAAAQATPLRLWAQLILDQAPQPPSAIGPAPLNPSGSGVIPASAISLATSASCEFTNGDTMLVCQITPSGATWGTTGFVVFNVLLTATSGHAQISPAEVVRIRPAAE